MLTISKRIIGWQIPSGTVAEAANQPAPAKDVDPRFLYVERRVEGTWPAGSTKRQAPSSEGTEPVRYIIAYGEVCGTKDGVPICINRPLEFFFIGEGADKTHQWITTNFRSLSQHARTGVLSRALKDMRKVQGDETIWMGKSPSGKTLIHKSKVAFIAWCLQEQLRIDGYFDDDFNEVPLEWLVARHERHVAYVANEAAILQMLKDGLRPASSASTQASGVNADRIIGRCPETGCGGDLVSKDGCPTCMDCGYSKCG